MTESRAWCCFIAALIIPGAASAQASVTPAACRFDTAAHTDTLTLEFSLRAFRGKDVLPDPVLTRAFGDMIRSRLVAPPTIGQLFYPNTYFPARYPHGFESIFGTLQFAFQPDGTLLDPKWFATSADPATDARLEQALLAAVAAREPQDLAPYLRWAKPQEVRLQFLATQDPSLHSPLLKMRVPMIRIDSGMRPIMGQAVLVPRDMIRVSTAQLDVEVTLDEAGQALKAGIQIISFANKDDAMSDLAHLLSRRFTPAIVGGCPVSFRLRTGVRG